MDQLEDNLAALDLVLPEEVTAALNEATNPTLPFPCDFLSFMPGFFAGGATINEQPTTAFGGAPEGDDDRY